MQRLADVVHRHVREGRGVTLLAHQRSHLVTGTKDNDSEYVRYVFLPYTCRKVADMCCWRCSIHCN
jgi:hypothetical protein